MHEVFGWTKSVGLMCESRHHGQPKARRVFPLPVAAYVPIRMRDLCAFRTDAWRSVSRSGGWRAAAE
jgi:hypothetical protein